ncbi:hypothetical protein ACTFIV_010848 [Dictyostelium citrinum]
MKKLLLLTFVLILGTFQLVKSQTLPQDELNAAIDLIYFLKGVNTTNPCDSAFISYIYCMLNTDGSGNLTVTQIKLNIAPTYPVETDFTIFKNLISLYTTRVDPKKDVLDNIMSWKKLKILYIGNQYNPIDPNIVLPSSLYLLEFSTISVPIPEAIFKQNLTTLNVINPRVGYSLPNTLPSNTLIDTLWLAVTCYSGFPTNLGSALTNLDHLILYIQNNRASGYKDFNFPSLDSLPNLKILDIEFDYDFNNQLWPFPNQIENLISIETFYSSGNGFAPGSYVPNFSKLNKGFHLSIDEYCDFLNNNCSSKPCILLPENTILDIYSCSLNLNNIDYSKLNSFIYINSKLPQPLPSFSTISKLQKFDVTESSITGTIPQVYCNIPLNGLKLGENNLIGEVPSCFTCVGQDAASSILENNFSNFNSTTQASNCPSFSISLEYNHIAKTDGSTIITISGTDFGWYFENTPNPYDQIVPQLNISIPNKEILLSIPVGTGLNKQLTAYFGYQFRNQVTFNYSYEAPFLRGYSFIDTSNNGLQFVINGDGFSFIDYNNVTFNGKLYTATIAQSTNDNSSVSGTIGSGIIGFSNNDVNPISSLSTGDQFTLFINVDGQQSNTITFYYFISLSLNSPTLKLYIQGGGEFNLSGVFGTNDKTIVKVEINGVYCSISSVSTTNIILISYPKMNAVGNYQITVNVGGYLLSSTIEYIDNSTPTPKPTSSSNDKGDGNPSLSFKLSTSLSSLYLLLIFLILFI